MHLTYNVHKTWQQNCDDGPCFDSRTVSLMAASRKTAGRPVTEGKSFLGLPVNSRIGIAAGLLLNSRWIAGYADLGFDILTYKTVRSVARPCYPLPNWVFVEDAFPNDPDQPVIVRDAWPSQIDDISSAVCFGMPSISPELWREDVRRTASQLHPGQILIVSVVATPDADATPVSLAADFARCAAWAVEAGAHVVEANLSCPNVCSAEGTIYHDPGLSRLVAEHIRTAIGETPLLLKTGLFSSSAAMSDFLNAIAGVAQGITLVNCKIRSVLHRDGRPAFGADFVKVGVLGRSLHVPAVNAVRDACRIIQDNRLPLTVAAVGGVANAANCADFFDAGAAAVLCGSSPAYHPGLAQEIRQSHPEW